MQDTSSPKLTPALTASSHATPTAIVDDPFLPTPTGAENISLTSFLFPSRSFEIEQYTNLKDVVPEWEDDEVDELVVLSPKSKIPKSLSVIEETQEAPASPSISLFQNIKVISIPQTSPRVCVVKYAESGELYALKTYSKATISYDTPTLEYAVREQMILRLLTQMDAPFILKLRWSFQDREAMHIVTDYSPQGDMRAYIERSGPMAPANARICAAELVDALWALHRNGITHHAIRPEHILFDASGHILLTGFSRASVSAPNGPQISYSPQPANEQPRHRRELRDIDEWSAPEAVLGWPQDSAVDCWAFGLLLWYMITGKHAFIAQYERNSISALHLDVLSSLILHSFPELQAEDEQKDVRELVYWCLQRNARLRSTAQGIKGHSYFSAIDWAQLRMKKYPVELKPPATEDVPRATTDDLTELPESETLRGVNIAGFDFTPSLHQGYSQGDLSGGGFESQNFDVTSASLQEDLSEGDILPEELRIPSSKRTTYTSALESLPVTPVGSATASPASSVPRSDAPSTALYSCTSFGELRDSLKPRVLGKGLADTAGDFLSDDDLQSNRADRNHTARRASSSASLVAHLSRSESTIVPPSILIRSDTTDTVFSAGSGLLTSRPSSSLGGRGLRVRKYASLNFDLDTITSLAADLEGEDTSFSSLRPRSLATSRRVSFAGTLNEQANTSSTATNGLSPGEDIHLAPHSAPLGASQGPATPWSLRSLISSPAGASVVSPSSKLQKKKRSASTPVLTQTPRLQEKVELPAGLKQIGLGIGYTHTPARVPAVVMPAVSTPVVSPTSGGVGGGDQTPSARRPTSAALQRCGALFTHLRPRGRGQGGGQGHMEAVRERASEESDALEAVMREMYGAGWDPEGGYAYAGGVGRAARKAEKEVKVKEKEKENVDEKERKKVEESEKNEEQEASTKAGVKRPGTVYSVPGEPGLTETMARSRGRHATSSTLRLVDAMDPPEDREFGI